MSDDERKEYDERRRLNLMPDEQATREDLIKQRDEARRMFIRLQSAVYKLKHPAGCWCENGMGKVHSDGCNVVCAALIGRDPKPRVAPTPDGPAI